MNKRSQPVADKKSDRAETIWLWIGLMFAWVVVMSVLQHGWRGYFTAFLLLYLLGSLVIGALFAAKLFLRYALPLGSLAFLVGWWVFGGTYSWYRDALVTLLVFPAMLLAFPASRVWFRRMPRRFHAWRRLRDRRIRHYKSAKSAEAIAKRAENLDAAKRWLATVPSRLWQSMMRPSTADKAPKPRPALRRLSPMAIASATIAVWLSLSGLDYVLEHGALDRTGSVVRPPAMPEQYRDLRVGLALSGGGFRAALMHAGVVDALGQLGIPITHLSSVSGGSIIASYLSLGGSPREFRNAVANARFRMKRDLLAVHNLVRLPSPAYAPGLNINLWPMFEHFSRLNVQANLVDRVLLDGARAEVSALAKGPMLIVCMTDLTYGLSVGMTAGGIFMVGPTSRRYFSTENAIDFPALPRLAERVAVSGAFPSAFPAVRVDARITTVPAPIATSQRTHTLELLLADGGIRDNLGLTLLEAADELAREALAAPPTSGWKGFSAPEHWILDLLLVSDGGKFLEAETESGVLATTMRAIDLSGLETGVLRPMRNEDKRPLVVLSPLSAIAPSPDTVIYGFKKTALRDRQHDYFRPAKLAADVLDKIVALVPDQLSAHAALEAYRQIPRSHHVNLDTVTTSCSSKRPTENTMRDCAWWRFVSIIGDDIWKTAEVFMKTPTLSDTFTTEEADAIFRFGQYLVLLRSAEILQRTASAAKRRSISSANPLGGEQR